MRRRRALVALAREVGKQSVERLGESLGRIHGEASALFRWLLTMLAAFNGAGFWFCMNWPGALPAAAGGRETLVGLFLGGLAAAFLAGLLGLVLSMPVARAMRHAIALWTDVSVSGDLTDDALAAAHIREVEQLFKVMRTQVDVVLPDGVAVLNAADPVVAEMAPLCDGDVIFYAEDPELPVLVEHLAQYRRAVFLRLIAAGESGREQRGTKE